MSSRQYDPGLVTARPIRTAPAVVGADRGLVVEELGTGFCGAVVACDKERVSLEDRHGKVRVFPLEPGGFSLDGVTVTLARPVGPAPAAATRSASGSVAVTGLKAQVAKASRLWVEGTHDAELVERVWGHDLRVEDVVVESAVGKAAEERVPENRVDDGLGGRAGVRGPAHASHQRTKWCTGPLPEPTPRPSAAWTR